MVFRVRGISYIVPKQQNITRLYLLLVGYSYNELVKKKNFKSNL